MLSIVEIDADDRIAAHVDFDADDIDAAFEELDARYLVGEAAAHAHTWSVIAAGLRRVQPARTSRDDCGFGVHRSSPARDRSTRAIWPRTSRAVWDITPACQRLHRRGVCIG